MRGSDPRTERLERLSLVASLFVAFETLERTIDAVLSVISQELPLASAIVIEESHSSSRISYWQDPARGPEAIDAAKRNAEELYAYLGGTSVDAVHERLTERVAGVLPGVAAEGGSSLFVAVPLVVERSVFGIVQVEVVGALAEEDVKFVNAIADQLAIALDRRRAWDFDIERRAEAEQREARHAEDRARALAMLERLEGIVDSRPDLFLWEADAVTHQTLYISARGQALLGLRRRRWAEHGYAWENCVHEDDRPHVVAVLEAVAASGRDAKCEHRCVASDGRVLWFRTGFHLTDADTDRPRIHGASVNVTAEKRAEERLRDRLGFIRAVAQSLGEGVIAVDDEDRITFLNAAASTMLGTNKRAAVGAPLRDLVRLELADGTRVEPRFSEVTRTGRSVTTDRHFLARPDGTRLPVSCTATPIRTSTRSSAGTVIALDDISERWAVESAQACLLEASRVLASSLDVNTALQKLTAMLLPRMGDFATVEVLSDAALERVAWSHVECAASEQVARLLARALPVPLSDHPALRVIRREKALMIHDGVVEWAAASDPHHVELFAALGARSLLMVPVSIGTRKIGLMTFVISRPGERYDRPRLELAEEIGRRAAYAIENGRLYADARRQTNVREQILGVVAHDLKNPLNTIMLAAAILGDVEIKPEDRALVDRSLGILERGSKRALRLIDDLLDFGSLEAGRLSMELARLSPAPLLAEAFEGFERQIEEKQLRVEIAHDIDRTFVLGDHDRLLQVIANLVANAIKVSPRGGRLRCSVNRREEDVVFAISDDGPGIAPSDLAHLFERYWRGAKPIYKGTGLGLAISAGIIGAHDGRIWAESTLGEGATFYFTLPAIDPRT
jgi:PAS domain S-box-containing protein